MTPKMFQSDLKISTQISSSGFLRIKFVMQQATQHKFGFVMVAELGLDVENLKKIFCDSFFQSSFEVLQINEPQVIDSSNN